MEVFRTSMQAIRPPDKIKRRRRRGKANPMAAFKSTEDLLMFYPQIVAKAFNSCDNDYLLSSLERICLEDLVYVENNTRATLPDGKVHNLISPRYREIHGMVALKKYWDTLSVCIPDLMLSVVPDKIRLCSDALGQYTLIESTYVFSGTRVFDYDLVGKPGCVYVPTAFRHPTALRTRTKRIRRRSIAAAAVAGAEAKALEYRSFGCGSNNTVATNDNFKHLNGCNTGINTLERNEEERAVAVAEEVDSVDLRATKNARSIMSGKSDKTPPKLSPTQIPLPLSSPSSSSLPSSSSSPGAPPRIVSSAEAAFLEFVQRSQQSTVGGSDASGQRWEAGGHMAKIMGELKQTAPEAAIGKLPASIGAGALSAFDALELLAKSASAMPTIHTDRTEGSTSSSLSPARDSPSMPSSSRAVPPRTGASGPSTDCEDSDSPSVDIDSSRGSSSPSSHPLVPSSATLSSSSHAAALAAPMPESEPGTLHTSRATEECDLTLPPPVAPSMRCAAEYRPASGGVSTITTSVSDSKAGLSAAQSGTFQASLQANSTGVRMGIAHHPDNDSLKRAVTGGVAGIGIAAEGLGSSGGRSRYGITETGTVVAAGSNYLVSGGLKQTGVLLGATPACSTPQLSVLPLGPGIDAENTPWRIKEEKQNKPAIKCEASHYPLPPPHPLQQLQQQQQQAIEARREKRARAEFEGEDDSHTHVSSSAAKASVVVDSGRKYSSSVSCSSTSKTSGEFAAEVAAAISSSGCPAPFGTAAALAAQAKPVKRQKNEMEYFVPPAALPGTSSFRVPSSAFFNKWVAVNAELDYDYSSMRPLFPTLALNAKGCMKLHLTKELKISRIELMYDFEEDAAKVRRAQQAQRSLISNNSRSNNSSSSGYQNQQR